jgi:hypothetical protein
MVILVPLNMIRMVKFCLEKFLVSTTLSRTKAALLLSWSLTFFNIVTGLYG